MENNPNHVNQQLIRQVNGSLHKPLQYLFFFQSLNLLVLALVIGNDLPLQ